MVQCLWRKKTNGKEVEMTPSEIKQLTPDGYGGDFEMTMEVDE